MPKKEHITLDIDVPASATAWQKENLINTLRADAVRIIGMMESNVASGRVDG